MTVSRNRLYALVLIVCFVGFAWLYLHLGSSSEVGNTFCWIKTITGLPCPACGTTRAIVSILNGEVVRGIQQNPFGLPVLVVMIVSPVWILADILLSGDSFFRYYQVMEKKLKRKDVYFPLAAIVIANWIWNYYKGY